MKIIIRHVVIATIFSLFLAIIIIGVTFVAFPLNHWSDIVNKEIGDVPYLVIVITIPLMLGIIFGLIYGIHVKQRFKQDRKSTRLYSSHVAISYTFLCL